MARIYPYVKVTAPGPSSSSGSPTSEPRIPARPEGEGDLLLQFAQEDRLLDVGGRSSGLRLGPRTLAARLRAPVNRGPSRDPDEALHGPASGPVDGDPLG